MKACPLYHVTTPEILPLILEGGFKDHASRKGIPGLIVTHQFEPGVWLADVPPITVISVDQYAGRKDEAWIEVMATEEFYRQHMLGNEWQDESWPTRQWLVPAEFVNQLRMREVPLVEVLTLRLLNQSTEHHRYYTPAVMRRQIATEMSGEVQARWNAALDAAVRNIHEEAKQ
jgi:hypothetical protein